MGGGGGGGMDWNPMDSSLGRELLQPGQLGTDIVHKGSDIMSSLDPLSWLGGTNGPNGYSPENMVSKYVSNPIDQFANDTTRRGMDYLVGGITGQQDNNVFSEKNTNAGRAKSEAQNTQDAQAQQAQQQAQAQAQAASDAATAATNKQNATNQNFENQNDLEQSLMAAKKQKTGQQIYGGM